MIDTVVEAMFERPFQLWRYSVSHGQLLFRSTAGDGRRTRVDVLFTNVSAMLVRASYDRLVIRSARPDEEVRINEATGEPAGPHARYYVIDGEPLSFVVAGAVASAEDEGGYAEPSTLLSEPSL
jgi:hypothetical protein